MLKDLKIKRCKGCKYFKQVNLPTCDGKIIQGRFCTREFYIQPLKLFCFKKEK